MSDTPRTRPETKERATTEVVLEYPITIGGVLTDKVSVRRPTVKERSDIQRQNIHEVDKELQLVAKVIGAAPSDLDDMDAADYDEIRSTLDGFFTGRKAK